MKAISRIILMIAILLWIPWTIQAGDTVRVARVIDGDTFVTEDSTHVHILGIDCPERGDTVGNHAWIREMGTIFVRLVTAGRDVQLIYDWQRRDRYGRTLAYVMVDGADIGAAMLNCGWALVTRQFLFEHRIDYIKLEEYARSQKRGLWAQN